MMDKAQLLIEALPYIKKYHDKVVVVKYGGNAMLDETLKQAVMSDIVLLSLVGVKVVLVHGGGPEINEVLKKMNKEVKFINGLRYTDEETMKVVQMVLTGKVNKDLVSYLNQIGGQAIGLCGLDASIIKAEKINDDLGFVGDIVKVNTKPLTELLNLGYIPVISTVGSDNDGVVYNINADTAASKLAIDLEAENLIIMSDVKGLLSDKSDETSLLPVVKLSEVPLLLKEGVISGGMIPKIDCCVQAIRSNVKKAVIIDGRIEHSILIEMMTNDGIGTMFIN